MSIIEELKIFKLNKERDNQQEQIVMRLKKHRDFMNDYEQKRLHHATFRKG